MAVRMRSQSETNIASIPAEQDFRFQLLTEKIDKLSQLSLSSIHLKTIGQVVRDLGKENRCLIATKGFALAGYVSLLVAGFFTTCASFDLIQTAYLPSIFSSDEPTRVEFANLITNVGALFVCVTDLPAITYVFYQLMLSDARKNLEHNILDESYHACITGSLSPKMREALYQWHIQKLQQLKVSNFALCPDPLSATGALHTSLAPVLASIYQDIQAECHWQSNIDELLKRCWTVFYNDPCSKKLGKVAGGALAMGTWVLSCYLFLASAVLLVDTPLGDLFSNDVDAQTTEAFYITQLGCGFSSCTAFGAAAYTVYRLFIHTPRQGLMQEKIRTCFDKHKSGLQPPQLAALEQIQKQTLTMMT